jgi:hypothetical protein
LGLLILQNQRQWCALYSLKVNAREQVFAHTDTSEQTGQLCVNIGSEDYARKEISVNFSMNLIWLRCQSVISMPDSVSSKSRVDLIKSFNVFSFSQVLVTTKNALSYTLTLKQRSKIVLGMIVVSAVTDRLADTVMFDVITFLSFRERIILNIA